MISFHVRALDTLAKRLSIMIGNQPNAAPRVRHTANQRSCMPFVRVFTAPLAYACRTTSALAVLTCMLLILSGLIGQALAGPVAAQSVVALKRTPSGHLVAPVIIAGNSTYFLVDTGASGTVINTDAVTTWKLGKPKAVDIDGIGAGGSMPAGQLTVSSLRLGDFLQSGTQIFAMDISETLKGLAGPTGGSRKRNKGNVPLASGILGQDFLVAADAILDAKSALLIVGAKNWLRHNGQAFTGVPLVPLPTGPSAIDVKVNGARARLMIDSGAADIMLDTTAVKTLGFPDLTRVKGASAAGADGRRLALYLTQPLKLTVGPILLADDPLLAMDLSPIRREVMRAGDMTIHGVIGLEPLAAKGALIYLAGKRLLFEKSK